MRDLLPFATLALALGGLAVALSVLQSIRGLLKRMEILETDHAWFINHREEQLQALQAEIVELRSQVDGFLERRLDTHRDPDDPRKDHAT